MQQPIPSTSDTGISAQWSGITNLESVQGYAGLGTGSDVFSGNFLRNESGGYVSTPTPSVLTLTGLPAHTSVSLGFLLAVIDSWDGNSNEVIAHYPVGPDYFNVRVVDGNNIWTFSQTFTNFTNVSQSVLGARCWAEGPVTGVLMLPGLIRPMTWAWTRCFKIFPTRAPRCTVGMVLPAAPVGREKMRYSPTRTTNPGPSTTSGLP